MIQGMIRLEYLLIPFATYKVIKTTPTELHYFFTDVFIFGIRIARFHRNEFNH
jgi:hypothetical protein